MLWRLSLLLEAPPNLFPARSSWRAKLQNSNGLSGSCIKLPSAKPFNPWRVIPLVLPAFSRLEADLTHSPGHQGSIASILE